jgi:hypothetical protein
MLCLQMCNDKWGSDFKWNKWQSKLLWIFELKYLFIVGLNKGYSFYKKLKHKNLSYSCYIRKCTRIWQ